MRRGPTPARCELGRDQNMSLDPLFAAPIVVQVHAFAAMAAFVLGIVQFSAPKKASLRRTRT